MSHIVLKVLLSKQNLGRYIFNITLYSRLMTVTHEGERVFNLYPTLKKSTMVNYNHIAS